jgi:hypothetical protein
VSPNVKIPTVAAVASGQTHLSKLEREQRARQRDSAAGKLRLDVLFGLLEASCGEYSPLEPGFHYTKRAE